MGLGQRKYKTSWEYLPRYIVPESKEGSKKTLRTCQKDTRANLKKLPIAKGGTI